VKQLVDMSFVYVDCSCLLAVLSYNHDVTIFANSTGESWDKVYTNIMQQLLLERHLHITIM